MNEIFDFLDSLFGLTTNDLTTWHVVARSVLVFLFGIALVRIGRKRFIGKLSAFDTILAITIGSLLSKAITMKDLFLEILVACLVLVLFHRLFSFVAARSDLFGTLIKGKTNVMVEDGEVNWDAVRKSDFSEHDFKQSIRLNSGVSDMSKIEIARLERNGDISIVLKEEETK